VGCTFNHSGGNKGVGVKILGAKPGYIFTGCQMFYSKIVLEDSWGVAFDAMNFGKDMDISVKGGTLTVMSDTKDVIGSGPYTLQSYSESEVVFARNENYQPIKNEGAVGVAAEAKCYLDTITVQLNTDAASRTAATMTGEYDIGSISSDMVQTALTMGVKKFTTGTAWTHAIFFNLHESNADSPIYDVNVRKAIRAAIDCKAVMLSILSGDESRINLDPYPIVKEVTAYNTTIMEDCGEWNNPNLELAKEYLKKANYDGTPLVYLTNATGAFYKACMAVVPMMESIGLKVEVMAVDGGSHGALRKDPATGHDIGAWETQKQFINPVMQTSFVNNVGSTGWWSNPIKTEALKIMNSTPTGSPESVAAYKDFMQAVVDDVPYIAFGFPTGIGYCRENVQRGAVGKDTFYYWNDYFLENPRTK
jgi:ABC-type transport system substrate-binding protein